MSTKKVLIYGQRLEPRDLSYVETISTVLTEYGYTIHTSPEYHTLLAAQHLDTRYAITATTNPSEGGYLALFSLGGDGTILNASKWIGNGTIPILGINLGRLGFLSSIENTKIKEAVAQWHEGQFKLEKRGMLRLDCNRPLFADFPYALNDFTIHKKDTSSMITIHTYLNGEELNSYWADGLIVSTATGSTGYSLSCGGPIVYPGSGNIVVTPVAPHNLNVRPMVLPDTVELKLEVDGRADSFLCTLDSRFETITKNDTLTIKKGDFDTRMISLKDQSFMKTIRNKLSWGLDKRN